MSLLAASGHSFWLQGARWQFPSFENAETFVARLEKAQVIARDATVAAALEGDPQALSLRSIQRRFVAVCGMTHTALRQIESMRRYVGATPATIVRADQQLSFLYKK